MKSLMKVKRSTMALFLAATMTGQAGAFTDPNAAGTLINTDPNGQNIYYYGATPGGGTSGDYGTSGQPTSSLPTDNSPGNVATLCQVPNTNTWGPCPQVSLITATGKACLLDGQVLDPSGSICITPLASKLGGILPCPPGSQHQPERPLLHHFRGSPLVFTARYG